MSNPKPNFFIVIKTSIPSITKPMNIGPSSKRSTNQSRITFQPDISKPHRLSFLHSMYNPIKLSNQSSLNFKERRENSNKFPHSPTENISTNSKTRIPLIAPSVLIGEENSHLDEELYQYNIPSLIYLYDIIINLVICKLFL